tara:strand:- start:314 stop:1528 length:1215 start_codon:yes stop_codon:yes gene_type:complete
MKVHSSFNQNISAKHLLKGLFSSFKSYESQNKEMLSEILNIPTSQFSENYYQSQRAGFYDFLLFLKAKEPQKDIVVLPSYTCCVLVNAVLKAGLNIEFVDTKKDSLNYDIQKMQQTMDSKNNQILAVLIPSNFGESFDQDLVNQYKSTHNLILDLANTLTTFNFKDFKAVLLSFGSNKLLDAIYGGALIVDSNIKFKSTIKKVNLSFELKALFKAFNFVLLRKFLNSILTKALFYIFKNLNLFPRVISNYEKDFEVQNINYFKPSKIFNGLLNQTLRDFKHSENSTKLKKLHASLGEYSLKDIVLDNSTCFYPVLIKNPDLLYKKLKKQNFFISLEWTFSQIVPVSANTKIISFKPSSYPNSKNISKNLILIPINNSLDYKSISNIIHIIFDHIHENKVTNHQR